MRVSVALASFNGEEYIEAQIGSILQNLSSEDEIIISDDGSTDRTLDILTRFASQDPRVKLTLGPGRGVIANFEHALRRCTGDIVFLSDQDDIWLPGKVARVVEEFADSETTCVVHDVAVVDADLQTLHDSYFSLRNSGPGLIRNWVKVTYLGAAMAFRSSLLDVSLPIPAGATMHDQWIGSLSEMCGRCVFIDERLSLYRRHEANVTALNRRGTVTSVLRKRARSAWALSLMAVRLRLAGPDLGGSAGRERRWLRLAPGKQVVTLEQDSLSRDAYRLSVMVRDDFEPQLVLGIVTGGAVVSELMDFGRGVVRMDCSMRRPGSTGSSRFGLSARFVRRMPYAVSDVLRRIEDRVLAHRPATPRPPTPELAGALDRVASTCQALGLRRVVIVDDAVDSGATLHCVRRTLASLLPDEGVEIRTCAVVLTRSRAEVLEVPDYVLYQGVLCRFPWSHDFRVRG